jgi:hypothetical protein
LGSTIGGASLSRRRRARNPPDPCPSFRDNASRTLPTYVAIVFFTTDAVQQAAEDDVIPFTTPITTSTGEKQYSLTVAKGTVISSPIRAMNRSEEFWGPNAKEFEPERWLQDADTRSKEISGHRHLLTFSDGPRICLGKNFALTEFKVRLSCFCH